MCQLGDWRLPQLRTAAQLMNNMQFQCVNDSEPQMNGVRFFSVMKHLLEAHWVPGSRWDRRVLKKDLLLRGTYLVSGTLYWLLLILPVILQREFMSSVDRGAKQSDFLKLIHLQKRKRKFRPNSISPQTPSSSQAPHSNTAPSFPKSFIHLVSWCSWVPPAAKVSVKFTVRRSFTRT